MVPQVYVITIWRQWSAKNQILHLGLAGELPSDWHVAKHGPVGDLVSVNTCMSLDVMTCKPERNA